MSDGSIPLSCQTYREHRLLRFGLPVGQADCQQHRIHGLTAPSFQLIPYRDRQGACRQTAWQHPRTIVIGFNPRHIGDLTARGVSETIGPAIRQYYALLEVRASGRDIDITRGNANMIKLIEKNPASASIVPAMDIRPGSGEYVVLGWLNRQ